MLTSGMLASLLILDASLAIHGSDEANDDGKSKDGDKGKQGDDKGAGDPDKKDDQDADKKGDESITLTDPNDIRAWNNFKEERDRLHGKVRTAEDERDAAKQELATLKAAGATDDDAKQQITSLTGERDAAVTERDSLRIENAVLKTSGYDWQNPAAAIRLLDLSSIEVDKNGKVIPTALKTALDALVKENPFLLKPKTEDVDKDDADKKDKPGSKKTGDPAGGARGGNSDKDKQAREAKLLKKYPALRRGR